MLFAIIVAAAGGGWTQTWSGTVVLTGNHPGEAVNLAPVAHADAAAQLNMEATLALRNRTALDQLLRDQQDPASPRYQQWLTPAQFTARFGPARQDVDAVAQWLGAQGFTVSSTSPAQRYVRFSGTVANAERAFNTTIMAFGNGSAYSNVTDPAIPARFGGVISRIGGLDNFLHAVAASQSPATAPTAARESASIADALALLDSGPALSLPDVVAGGFGPAFGPSDLRSFYNEIPLIAGGVNGAGGDCLAIVGTSDYTPGAVNLFDRTFALPASSITTVVVDGANPGINGVQDESLLDLEWSHAMAPGAPSRFYLGNGATASPNGSVVDAIARAVSDNACGVISVSFSLCGGSAAFFLNVVTPIYQQAAAHGQSIFISSGDWGAAGLILDGTACAVATTRTVNELGSDPNVTEVGGTAFNPNFDAFGNDLGHVAESAWNDSAIGGRATGGGVSAFYPKPGYQTGPGVPRDGRRDVPDVALIASPNNPGSFWGSTSSGAPVIECCIGGTSLSTPAWAGIAKLIAQLGNQRRLGPLNPRLYALANAGMAAAGFRDVTSGNNDYNGVPGFSAGPGFDLNTGWGSVDISTLANNYVAARPPAISSVTSPVLVGSSFAITGSFFSPGAKVNFFVATGSGPLNAGPLTPSFASPSQLIVPVPVTVPLGQGFVTVQVVNTDLGFKTSNTVPAL
ncbi:MAG TPA: S53 family peptidase, partial [Candidatus Binataceae bacterium]